MELWIRSQDKKRLLKIDDIGLADYNGYYYVVGYKNGKEIKLGEYGFHISTRALEVLDEIQNILNPRLFVNVKPSEETTELLGGLQHGKILKMKNDFEYKEISTCVYEMPKE